MGWGANRKKSSEAWVWSLLGMLTRRDTGVGGMRLCNSMPLSMWSTFTGTLTKRVYWESVVRTPLL